MQRLAVLTLCAFVALATVWMLVRSGEPTGGGEQAGGSIAATPLGPAGSLAPSPSGAESRRLRGASVGNEGSAGGFAARSGAGYAATQAARNGSSGSGTDAARSDTRPSGQGAAPSFEGRAPIGPEDVEGWARAPAQKESVAAAEVESAEASPSEPNAQTSEGGVLSAEEIARRVEKVLPDGLLPPDELPKARERERQRILEHSKLAAALVQPGNQEPSPGVSSEQPAVTLPQGNFPAALPKSKSAMSGTDSRVAPSR